MSLIKSHLGPDRVGPILVTSAARARWPILGAALVIILAFHGRHTTWETTIRQAAIRFSQSWQAPA